MSYFRFIVEGSEFKMPARDEGDGEGHFITGFFTTRKCKAPDIRTAESIVLEKLKQEWAQYDPRLTVVDAWKIARIQLRRVPNKGHAFFSDEESRYAAASIEADIARAPEGAAIWRLASLDVRDDE